jgi:cytochrome P450
LQQEADQVLGENHLMNHYADHDALVYTEAVIHETLRIKSVAPVLLLEPLEDIEMEDYHFGRGAKIIVLTRAGALSPEYFSDSEQFNPDRWLSTSNSKCPVHNLTAFMPFGAGPRMCPGKHLALLEMKLVLSMMAKNFSIELVHPEVQIQENLAFTMMPDKFNIRLVRRL